MCFYACITLLLITGSALCHELTSGKSDSKYEWDILIFTQRWPVTACSQWEEGGKDNTCNLPDLHNIWTVHGIWPTKSGTKGPANCNTTWHFNATVIKPIELELEEYWINIENNTKLDSLWKHEWVKHGTCAAALPKLNSELHYFNQGLDWIKKYNMQMVLSQRKVTPNKQGYPVQEIFESVRYVLNKNPTVQCVVDKRTKLSLISEIRICFDKTLNLVDCDAVKGLGDFMNVNGILTNCNLKQPVIYSDQIVPYAIIPVSNRDSQVNVAATRSDPVTRFDSLLKTRHNLISIYRTIKFLISATI